MRYVMSRLADRLGCTEGQAYTLVVGSVLALVVLFGTIPAMYR